MTARSRSGTFAIAFAIAYPILYIACVELNLAAFTYHPALGVFAFGADRPREGLPAMYWYGWIASSAVAALVIAAVAAYLPDGLVRKLPAASAWVVPFAAVLVAAGLMIRMYFFR
jgi:hypothetical protein